MKRPYSPSDVLNTERDSRSFSSGLGMQMNDETNSDSLSLPSAFHKSTWEGKQRRYMLCEVCNIQLNSAAQAQIHYNGKSHQKRLKQISNGKMSSNTGRCCGAILQSNSAIQQNLRQVHTCTHTHTHTHKHTNT